MEYKKIFDDEKLEKTGKPDYIEINNERIYHGQGYNISNNIWIALRFYDKYTPSLHIKEKMENFEDDVNLYIKLNEHFHTPTFSNIFNINIDFNNGKKTSHHLKLIHGIDRANLITNGYYYTDKGLAEIYDTDEYLDLQQVGNAENYLQILINFLLEKKEICQSRIMTECKDIIMQFISEAVSNMVNTEFITDELKDELQNEINKLKERVQYLESVQTKINEESNIRTK